MLYNYLKIALRNARRHPGYSLINISGLAIGMACAILIFLSVRQDLAFDRFHEKSDRIYRVLTIDRALGLTSQRVGITLPALGPAAEAEIPEVERAVRLGGGGRQLFRYGDRSFYADPVRLAEPSLFEIFDFPFLAGDPAGALAEPGSVVLTESLARRLFGEEDPIGKTINNGNDLTVTGVLADLPVTSHLNFEALISLYPPEDQAGWLQWLSSWNSISMVTYVLLEKGADPQGLDAKLEQIIRGNEVSENFSATLQPLTDIHLRSSNLLFDANAGKGDIGYVYGLSAVALFVLLIASFNFMNLSTARSAERAREVGVRKVAGATRRQLISQYLGESIVLCLFAFLLAIALVMTAVPPLNAALGKSMSFDLIRDPGLAVFLLGLALGVAVLSGSYPAFVLSRFVPARVLKGVFHKGRQGQRLRQVLVVTQFAASVVMIIGALLVAQQLNFIIDKNLGYQRDQVLLLATTNPTLQAGSDAFRDELLQHPSILAAAKSNTLPGRTLPRTGVVPEGASDDDNWIVNSLSIDEHFIPVLDIEMASGRNYDRSFGTDQQAAILINEAAARALGWAEPLGRRLTIGQQEREVIGVVSDFHFASVRHRVEPLIMFFQPGNNQNLAVKLDTQNLPETVRFVEEAWTRHFPDHPFEYGFLDEEFAAQYREERNFAFLSQGFGLLAILIACLGLFGLASFTMQQRTKEIGIRKTLGASVPGIVLLLSRDFLKLVVVAFVIAAPVAYLAMNHWLQDFAYRIDISWIVFAVAGAAAFAVAVLTVSYQSIRTATADPVRSLRYE